MEAAKGSDFDQEGRTDLFPAETPLRPRLLVALHWASAILLALALGFILTRELIEARVSRAWLLDAHRWCGLLLLCFCAWRLLLRLRLGRLQDLTPHAAAGERAAAATTHLALYALLAVLPLLGWAACSAAETPINFFGLPVPPLGAPDEDAADALQAWHSKLGWALMFLICIHAGAALWHHFVRRDGVLWAMLPQTMRNHLPIYQPNHSRRQQWED